MRHRLLIKMMVMVMVVVVVVVDVITWIRMRLPPDGEPSQRSQPTRWPPFNCLHRIDDRHQHHQEGDDHDQPVQVGLRVPGAQPPQPAHLPPHPPSLFPHHPLTTFLSLLHHLHHHHLPIPFSPSFTFPRTPLLPLESQKQATKLLPQFHPVPEKCSIFFKILNIVQTIDISHPL